MQIRIAAKKIPSISTPGLGRDLATAMVGSAKIPMVKPPSLAYSVSGPNLTTGALSLSNSIRAASPIRKPMGVSKGLFQ
ncbi:unnamed protein product [Cylindrotheca closterium]|uniref:Uncharacterized protein n=1 Tax=Cylindrotheca closterium TaxID=2856 RepID=A0AAD2CZ73_9STRA|nr:unnamed protein product [Cylindrotheca closterium]CAJ1965747.1 unnamed protein product [Cylindrotheca closterium]